MKKIIVLSLMLMVSHGFSETKVIEKIVKQETTAVEVALNEATVLCSSSDYMLPFLKVLIPQLAELTVLNHRNLGAGAPCVAAGSCVSFGDEKGNRPSDILDPKRPTEKIDIQVTLKKVYTQKPDKKSCTVQLHEEVRTNIRGKEFYHLRTQDLGERLIEDCV